LCFCFQDPSCAPSVVFRCSVLHTERKFLFFVESTFCFGASCLRCSVLHTESVLVFYGSHVLFRRAMSQFAIRWCLCSVASWVARWYMPVTRERRGKTNRAEAVMAYNAGRATRRSGGCFARSCQVDGWAPARGWVSGWAPARGYVGGWAGRWVGESRSPPNKQNFKRTFGGAQHNCGGPRELLLLGSSCASA